MSDGDLHQPSVAGQNVAQRLPGLLEKEVGDQTSLCLISAKLLSLPHHNKMSRSDSPEDVLRFQGKKNLMQTQISDIFGANVSK